MSKLSAQEIQDFLVKISHNPTAEPRFLIEELREDFALVRMPTRPTHLRPGDTISGPTQMALADAACWIQILHNLGLGAAPSVTSNLNISFLSRPAAVDLLAESRLLKLGRTLAVSEVRLLTDHANERKLVAHATVTYAVRSSDKAR